MKILGELTFCEVCKYLRSSRNPSYATISLEIYSNCTLIIAFVWAFSDVNNVRGSSRSLLLPLKQKRERICWKYRGVLVFAGIFVFQICRLHSATSRSLSFQLGSAHRLCHGLQCLIALRGICICTLRHCMLSLRERDMMVILWKSRFWSAFICYVACFFGLLGTLLIAVFDDVIVSSWLWSLKNLVSLAILTCNWKAFLCSTETA